MRARVLAILFVIGALATPIGAQDSAPRRVQVPGSAIVAIVPFSNITGEAGDAWIGAGIAETLVADLQRQDVLDVIGGELVADTMSTMGLAGDTAPGETNVLEIARRVGAQWVVSGGYQRFGDRIRITGRMVEVITGTVVRSAKVDGAVADLFALQDLVVDELVNAAATDAAVASLDRPRREGPPRVADPGAATPAPQQSPQARVPPLLADPAGAEQPGSVSAVPSTVSEGGASTVAMIDGPPPPIAPDVITRDEAGRATIRAIKLTQGIRLDGRLDEQVYDSVSPVTDFIQQLPDEGAPGTERTEAWIMFDQTNMYVAARLWASVPPSEWVANEMRRDTVQLSQNDHFGVLFDTFYDRRNASLLYTNALGALADQQITNEGNPNVNWNPIWDVRTGRFEGGWTVEMEIPFKSLRYRSGPVQVWGVQLRRIIRRKNEFLYITPIPASFGPNGGHRVSAAATLVGVEVPTSGRNLEIKPYGIGGVTTNVAADPPVRGNGDGDFGFDVKYGITRSLTADFTYNSDFAQVEVDEQQVNLTRFSLFFPEKREFFVEGQGIFSFGSGGGFPGGGGSGASPTIFFSRRIGLEGDVVVPILGGGRVTGKIGPFDVGALSIQTDDIQKAGVVSTNFTAVRVKRDILRRSSVGGIFTNRSVSLIGDGSSQVYGLDGDFSFYDNVEFLTYLAKTTTPGISERDASYQARFRYTGDRYGATADHLVVEDNFVPEVGFVRRDNFRRTNLSGRFSPRPQSIETVRQFTLEGQLDYFVMADTGLLETRQRVMRFDTEFENSDRVGVTYVNTYELLEAPFQIAPDVTIPVGGYDFSDVSLSYRLGPQRRVSGSVSFRTGSFWSGDIRSAAYSRGRINVLDQLSIEPSVSVNWIDLPEGSFTTTLVRSRFNYTFTPRMFFSGLAQYNSGGDSLSANLRLRWEYSPGSELFVVYTEDRDTDPFTPDRFSELRNRGFVVKINRLFRF